MKQIKFFAPSIKRYETEYFSNINHFKFVPISLTGSHCQLQCGHCRGKLLESMYPAENPEKLYSLAKRLNSLGVKGALISGGFSGKGQIALEEFLPTIRNIEEELGWDFSAHIGLINDKMAYSLKKAKVKTIMMDIPSSNSIIEKVFHLSYKVEDYLDSLKKLIDYEINVMPHLVIGLNYGKIDGEISLLERLAELNVRALIMVIFTPQKLTPMAEVNPPQPEEVGGIFLTARKLFRDGFLGLGCMRPAGEYKKRADLMALEADFNGIAYPHPVVFKAAEKKGIKITFSYGCCSPFE